MRRVSKVGAVSESGEQSKCSGLSGHDQLREIRSLE